MAASSPASAVLADLDVIRGAQEDFYRALHQNPELSHQEHRTAAAVADRLRQTGFQVHHGIGGGGIVGVLANGSGDIPDALGVPYTYWCIGGVDPGTYRRAERAGRVAQDIPVNHSAAFALVLQPTLDTGTQALVVAALAWLGR